MNALRCCFARPTATAAAQTPYDIRVRVDNSQMFRDLSPLTSATVGDSTQVRISSSNWKFKENPSAHKESSREHERAAVAQIKRVVGNELRSRGCTDPVEAALQQRDFTDPVAFRISNFFRSDGKSTSEPPYLTLGQVSNQIKAFALLDEVIASGIEPKCALALLDKAYQQKYTGGHDERCSTVRAAAIVLKEALDARSTEEAAVLGTVGRLATEALNGAKAPKEADFLS